MSKFYSIDYIAEDHIHTDITRNTEEPHQKYRLGTVNNRLLGDLNMFYLTLRCLRKKYILCRKNVSECDYMTRYWTL